MKTFRWILITLLSFTFTWAHAQQDQVVLKVDEVSQGQKWNLEVGLENPLGTNYTAFQMDLSLPAGFEWEAAGLQAAFRMMGHSCKAVFQPNGALRVIAYSANNVAIPGVTGALFKIPFHKVGEAVEGSFELSADPVNFVGRDGMDTYFSAYVLFDSHILMLGDANGDKIVDGEDIWTSMQKFLGVPVDLNMEAADVNKDGIIDGEDLYAIIQIYLQGSTGQVNHKK